MGYKVIFKRNGRDLETMYWSGTLEETRELATRIMAVCKADSFTLAKLSEPGEDAFLSDASLRRARIRFWTGRANAAERRTRRQLA